MKSPRFPWMRVFLAGLLFSLLVATPALAQEVAQIQLSLSRDFGYSSGTGKIQGTFSMHIRQGDNLARVVFLMDGQPMAEDTQPPFKLQFTTDSYPLGVHVMSALGYTADGSQLASNEIRAEFVSAQEGSQAALGIVGPILGVVAVIMLISFAGPMLTGNKKISLPPGTPRNYGLRGGAICPKCQRPFPIRVLAFNFGLHRLDRCPYCGKWSFVRSRSLNELRLAEAAELEEAQAGQLTSPVSEEERLRKELDDSRFQEH